MTTNTSTVTGENTPALPNPENFDPEDSRYQEYPLFDYLTLSSLYNLELYEMYEDNKRTNPDSSEYLDHLWHFVRSAKAHPALAECSPSEALSIIRGWLAHRQSDWTEFPAIESVEDGDTEFIALWEKIRYAAGESPITLALHAVDYHPVHLPDEVYRTDGYERFIGFCYHLQRIVGDAPIYLSVRSIGAALGVKSGTISHYRKFAEKDGYLAKVKDHTFNSRASSRATEFRFQAANL